MQSPHPDLPDLTYCLNVHPGESFADQWDAVKAHTTRIRSLLGMEDRPFGLGLRLGCEAVADLKKHQRTEAFHAWCRDHRFYVYTINGFPYGAFHGTCVKAAVYRPDWTCPERLSYTHALADILGHWLPRETEGSISTVPLWYAPDHHSDPSAAAEKAVEHLVACAQHLSRLERETGRYVTLALEPEPWCALETSGDVVSFFDDWLLPHGCSRMKAEGIGHEDAEAMLRRYVGICVDTCHCALAFESPADVVDRCVQAGIRIAKTQISAALSLTPSDPEDYDLLLPFVEPTYLHQTAQCVESGMNRWPDLPEALSALKAAAPDGETRVHYHVPLQWSGTGALGSTRDNMDARFWRQVRSGQCGHLEIETYTYQVLPAQVGVNDLYSSIAAEYHWVFEQLDDPPFTS